MSDSVVLYRAAGVIRKSISNLSFMTDFYPSSGDLNIENCLEFVPTPLIEFITLCTSEKAFNKGAFNAQIRKEDIDIKTLAICHNIIGHSQNIATPISFGLGIQLHHKFGSRQLIDTLHGLGYTIPYDEVRRFLTSAAAEDHCHDSTYIPRGMTKYEADDVNSIIDAAIDNFDQNEETLDGLSTTHCMAGVLYQRKLPMRDTTGIPRLHEKTLQTSHCTEESLSIYSKPHKRPEPKHVAEKSILYVSSEYCNKQVEMCDLVWKIYRNIDDMSFLPAWSGFNAMVSLSSIPVANVRYLPFISAPPTDFSTIYTAILRLLSIAKSLDQSHILVTADLAIYSKAQQIIWSRPDLQSCTTMRLGGMHLIMAFVGSIGKLYGDGGLLDILTSSNVYASSTAQMLLQGKHYAKGIRGVKIAHEALTHLYLAAAESYANKNDLPWVDDAFYLLAQKLQNSIKSKNQSSCSEIFQQLQSMVSHVIETLRLFQSYGNEHSGTFKYWVSFLEAGDLLLKLLRADKEANFQLHLKTVMEIVPFFYLAGRVNYARYTPVYVSEMRQLENKQPEMHKFLMEGGFVVLRSNKREFNCVPTDQALEQTINREAKGTGGVIGFTLRKTALLHWILTRHISGEYSEAFQQLFEKKYEGYMSEELGPSRMTRDKSDVSSVKDYIIKHCQNPFDVDTLPNGLINITTGQVATKVVADCLTTIPERGKNLVQN